MKLRKDDAMENRTTDLTVQNLTKELKFTRIICMISSVLTICLMAGGILLFGKVRELGEVCEPVMEKVSELDVESLNDTLAHINESLETVEWDQVAEALEELDVDAVNKAIEGLDTEELTQTLKLINDAAEKIQEIGDKMSGVFSWN